MPSQRDMGLVSGRVPALPEDIREDEIERVFDIAAKRLGQEVFDFGEAA